MWMIVGLDAPSTGDVTVAGEAVSKIEAVLLQWSRVARYFGGRGDRWPNSHRQRGAAQLKFATIKRSAMAGLGALCLLVAVAVAGPASAATATTTPALHSPNWAGYYAQVHGTGLPYDIVASFTVPAVSCKKSAGNAPYYGSMWAGIGGIDSVDAGAWLEQAGVEVTCASKTATPVYNPFWEIVSPNPSSPYHTMPAQVFKNAKGHDATVRAGDTIDVSVEGQDGEWTFNVGDERTQQDYFDTPPLLPAGTYTGRTVEAITEWPSGHAAKSKKLPSGLVDMGTVLYQQVDYDYTGEIQNKWYSVTSPITMTDNGHKVIYPGSLYKLGQQQGQVKNSFPTHYAAGWQNGM
jgi:hypothetical protein